MTLKITGIQCAIDSIRKCSKFLFPLRSGAGKHYVDTGNLKQV